MKHIPLKILADERFPEAPPIVYSDVLREVIRRPLNPQAGIQIAEMRQSLRVLDRIDAANGTLELEDSDYEHLKTKLLAMPWNVVDRRLLLQLIDEVTSV